MLDSTDKLVLYIANNIQEADLFKILLLVYLFDVEFYRKHRRTYTGASWILGDKGPFATEIEFSYYKLLNMGVVR